MDQRLVLVIGSGRCGTHAVAQLLSRQPDANVTHEQPPLLPWKPYSSTAVIRVRLARMRRERPQQLIGDAASFYLPYLEEAMGAEPDLRVICLKRPCEDVVASFCQWLDTVHPLPTNHWAANPASAWHHDPIWTRIFPQYELGDRQEGIRRYWREYYETVERLLVRFPERIRVFPSHDGLNSETAQRELLSFAGVPRERQVLNVGMRTNLSRQARLHHRRTVLEGTDLRAPQRCAVLVPYTTQIVPDCENALKELERRGYSVWRVRGYAAIDQGRNQMATDALVQGYEETMWIDADIRFNPDTVDALRSHDEPIVCGIYPQKGRRALACHVLPGTKKLVFGQGGGLHEILYAGTGFLRVRREVYAQLQRQLPLPVCNERFGRPTIPFFHPMISPVDDGSWYLAEDYAFCERARQCGYRILADTTIRLWHVGQYAYSWEDAGIDRDRYGTFTYHLS